MRMGGGSDDHPENAAHASCCMWAHMQHNACGPFSGWSSEPLHPPHMPIFTLFSYDFTDLRHSEQLSRAEELLSLILES